MPSYHHNPLGFRVGSIVRVRMINFMIYNEEEMRPGPGLNLLLGPNGSGQTGGPRATRMEKAANDVWIVC